MESDQEASDDDGVNGRDEEAYHTWDLELEQGLLKNNKKAFICSIPTKFTGLCHEYAVN